MNRKMPLREKYLRLTRDLDWEPSYRSREEIYPQMAFEGIRVTDWDRWEDPFRMTIDAYWKLQAEKERRLYAVIDAFAQNNGHLSLSDARYLSAVKLFLTGITPGEYNAHRGFAMAGRQFAGAGTRAACQIQAVDELRHAQTQIHAMSHYNKYFNGMSDFTHSNERIWYLSVPKSFFQDALSAGPFEYVVAICFSFEYVLTNLIFMPFMSGAAYNGDMATVTFGFSAQSDEARHMTLGLEVIKFLLEQHPDNVPIIQGWIDKWFWRGYRVLTLVAAMMDYMLPKRVMSWAEAWEMYFEQSGAALFEDLARYGIRMPKYWEHTVSGKHHISHQAWNALYNYGFAAAFHTWVPGDDELDWLSKKYPQSFDRHYRPTLEWKRQQQLQGRRFINPVLPTLCQICQVPMIFTEPDDPTTICVRTSVYRDERYTFCSDGCKDIFDHEPEKYVQAWMPTHQVNMGHCGGTTIEEVLAWYHIDGQRDGMDYEGSEDQRHWEEWTGRGKKGGEAA